MEVILEGPRILEKKKKKDYELVLNAPKVTFAIFVPLKQCKWLTFLPLRGRNKGWAGRAYDRDLVFVREGKER